MRLFFSHFEKQDEEEEEKKPRCNKRKRVASVFIMFLLISSTFSAGYAAAWPWDGLKEKLHNAWDTLSRNTLGGTVGAVGGMYVGATVAGVICEVVSFGACTPLLIAAFGVAGYATGAKAQEELDIPDPTDWFSSNDGGSGETQTIDRYANESNVENDDDNPDAGKIVDDATQEAHEAAAELAAKLRSDFVEYGLGGTTGQVVIHIYGPSSIYGFSAFPVQIRLEIPNQPVPFNKVHITEVTAYVIDENNRTYWTRVWNASTFSQDGYIDDTLDLVTVMKAPDPLVYQIRDAIASGQISKELYEQIWNTNTTHFEIHVTVKGYQEAWKTDSSITDQSSCPSTWYEDACWVHDKDIPFTAEAETTTAYGHVTHNADVATIDGGMLGSLPVKFLQSSEISGKWVLYQSKFAGALSDFIIITAASPIHVLNSTAMYKFLINPNPGYFQPANPKISDEYRFLTIRVIEGGSMELADSTYGHIGDLTEPTFFGLTAHYTDAPGTLDYHALGLVFAYVERDDGVKIPIWLASEPLISVLTNTYTIIKDQDAKNLVDWYKNNEREKIDATVKTLINGLQEKIDLAEQLLAKAKAVGNEYAIEYAESAIDEYKAAVEDLQKALGQDDYQMFLNYLNAAKKREMAGDFYVEAAKKALNGDLEQAKIDAEKAKEYSNLAKEYEPGFSLGGLLGEEGTKALIALVVAVILAGIVYIVVGNKRLAALVFAIALVVLLLVFFGDSISSLEESLRW